MNSHTQVSWPSWPYLSYNFPCFEISYFYWKKKKKKKKRNQSHKPLFLFELLMGYPTNYYYHSYLLQKIKTKCKGTCIQLFPHSSF
jgi:hypothetical protein